MWRLATAISQADHGEKHELPWRAFDVIICILENGEGLWMEIQSDTS